MALFGQALCEARQRRGLSLDDVARETRLARRFLAALEDESLNELPGGTYNRAYLRTYATWLGLKADELLRDYETEAARQAGAGQASVDPDAIATMREVAKHRLLPSTPAETMFGWWVQPSVLAGAALLLAGALTGLGWWVLRQPTPAERGPEASAAVDGIRSAPPGSPSAAQEVPIVAVTRGVRATPSPTPLAPDGDRPPARFDRTPVEAVGGTLTVPSSGVGTDVVRRELIGQADTFDVGTRVVFWTLVTGGRAGEAIRHVWFHEGRTAGAVDLPLGGPSWRTQSRRTLSAEGVWAVEARTEDGRVLARHEFRGTL